jgi:hypothetical protein
VSALLQKPAADASKDEPRTDFALGYDWADVRDEGEEGLSLLLAFRNTQSYNASHHTQISLPGYRCTPSLHLPLHIQPSCHTFCTLNPLFPTPQS